MEVDFAELYPELKKSDIERVLKEENNILWKCVDRLDEMEKHLENSDEEMDSEEMSSEENEISDFEDFGMDMSLEGEFEFEMKMLEKEYLRDCEKIVRSFTKKTRKSTFSQEEKPAVIRKRDNKSLSKMGILCGSNKSVRTNDVFYYGESLGLSTNDITNIRKSFCNDNVAALSYIKHKFDNFEDEEEEDENGYIHYTERKRKFVRPTLYNRRYDALKADLSYVNSARKMGNARELIRKHCQIKRQMQQMVFERKNEKRKDYTELDLHGLYVDEALFTFSEYWGRVKAEGIKQVLVVTGKGLHSTGKRARIRPSIVKKLKQMHIRYQYEVLDNGRVNKGALVLFTKRK